MVNESKIKSKLIRVLHICQRDDPAEGGAVRVAVEFIKRLSHYQIDAHCLFLYGKSGYFGEILGDHAHYLNITNSKEFLKFGRLVKFIQQFKPDILHHHEGLLWSSLLTFFHPNILKIAHAHLDANTKDKKILWDRRYLADWVQLQATDLLICITQNTQASQIKEGHYSPEKTCVLYNGIDQDIFKPPTPLERNNARQYFGLPENVFVLGFVGRLHCQMKGTNDFLKVLSCLPSNFWGLIVGSGPDEQYLKDLANQLRISPRIIFAGILKETVTAYHCLDIFCLTSHYEPFGLVIAEAMACQIPVIGFECRGGVSEILNSRTGLLIPNRNIEMMAQSILDLVSCPNKYANRLNNAITLLEQNHNWEINTSNLANLYKSRKTDIL